MIIVRSVRTCDFTKIIFLYHLSVKTNDKEISTTTDEDNIIIIFINCNCVVTQWQWLFYMYTKHVIGYY